MYALWYLFIPVLVDIRFLLHCRSVLWAVSEAVQSHWLFMSFLRFPTVTIFFSRFCFQMLNYSPISCFYLHYFKVSVTKVNPSFDPGVQRDAASRVCTSGWRRKAMNNAQHPFLCSGKSSPNTIALWQLSKGGRESSQTSLSSFFLGAFSVAQKFLQSSNFFYERGSERARGGGGTMGGFIPFLQNRKLLLRVPKSMKHWICHLPGLGSLAAVLL